MNDILDTKTWSPEEHKKSNSPNSIFFYIKKGMNLEESKTALKLHQKKLYEKTCHIEHPNKTGYWLKKGFTYEQAIEKVKEFQSNPLNLNAYIKKYGIEEGIKKYESRVNNLKNRPKTELRNIQLQYNCNISEAYEIYCARRIICSPWRIEYWENRGCSSEDAKLNVRKWQQEQSPRSVFYWVKSGYSEEDAIKKVSEYQDNNSIKAIQRNYKCKLEEAAIIQDLQLSRRQEIVPHGNRIVDKSLMIDFFLYKKEVNDLTNRTWRLFSEIVDPNNLRSREYHLDHKYSIQRGFINKVPPEIIASVPNLEILSASENSSKCSNCSIKLEELIEKYENSEYKNI